MGPIIMNGGYHPPTLLCEVGVVLKVLTHLLLVGSKIPDCDRIPCCPQPGMNFGTPGCSTHRPPQNSCVLWLGLAVQRSLVKVLPAMVCRPEKRGLVVKFHPMRSSCLAGGSAYRNMPASANCALLTLVNDQFQALI